MHAGIAATYLMSAVVDRRAAPELRTTAYSQTRFSEMLEDNPAAISLAPRGAGSGERLLELFEANDTDPIFRSMLEKHRRTDPWLLFIAHSTGRLALHQVVAREDELADSVRDALQRSSEPFIVLIRKVDTVEAPFEAFLAALTRRLDVGVSLEPPAPVTTESDREKIIRSRRQMLADAGGTYNSEELATAAQSITV